MLTTTIRRTFTAVAATGLLLSAGAGIAAAQTPPPSDQHGFQFPGGGNSGNVAIGGANVGPIATGGINAGPGGVGLGGPGLGLGLPIGR